MRILSRLYCVITALCLTLTSGMAFGQNPTVTQARSAGSGRQTFSCETTPFAPGAYSRCKLAYIHNELVRGDEHEFLARWRFLHVMPFGTFVSGDSAEHYAAVFQHAEALHQGLAGAGALMLVGSLVTQHICSAAPCSRSSTSLRTTAYAGGGLLLASIPFHVRSAAAMRKTIAFYNASLNRDSAITYQTQYARPYHPSLPVALRVRLIGSSVMFASSMVGIFSGHPTSRGVVAGMIGGGALFVLSYPLKWRADRRARGDRAQ
jgi:hypothetical protein